MSREGLLLVALPLLVLGLLVIAALVVVRRGWHLDRRAVRRAARLVEPDLVSPPRDRPAPPSRPWWGNPWLWVGVSAASVALGLLVWPGLFGGVFLFVPFVWVGRPRSDRMDPRTNGHTKRDGRAW